MARIEKQSSLAAPRSGGDYVSVERLSDLADPRVAAYRALSDANVLREQGCFIAEGRLVVRRLIEAGRFTIRSLVVNAAAFESLQPLLGSIPDCVPVFVCAPADLQAVTGHDIHRGCLALVERPEPPGLEALLDSVAAGPAGDPQAAAPPRRTVLVALDRVANPDNVGGVFRNAAAFGAAAILLGPGCSDPLYRKAIRTSMAATLQVPYALAGWPQDLGLLRARGFTLAALSPRPPAADIDALRARRRQASRCWSVRKATD